jgi:hypothetical protein
MGAGETYDKDGGDELCTAGMVREEDKKERAINAGPDATSNQSRGPALVQNRALSRGRPPRLITRF